MILTVATSNLEAELISRSASLRGRLVGGAERNRGQPPLSILPKMKEVILKKCIAAAFSEYNYDLNEQNIYLKHFIYAAFK